MPLSLRYNSRCVGTAVILCGGLLMSGTAAVAQATPRAPLATAAADDPPCFCWSDGKKIAEGLTACIRTGNGRRLAECGRVINMMSWQISDQICPES